MHEDLSGGREPDWLCRSPTQSFGVRRFSSSFHRKELFSCLPSRLDFQDSEHAFAELCKGVSFASRFPARAPRVFDLRPLWAWSSQRGLAVIHSMP